MKYIFLLILIINAIHSKGQKVWTLDQCIAYAKENNLQLKQATLSLDLLKESIKSNRLERLPNLNGQIGFGVNFGRTVDPTTYQFTTLNVNTSQLGLSSNINIYNGGRNKLIAKQLQTEMQASNYDVEKTFNDICLSIVSSYLQVLLAQEQVAIAERYLSLTQKQLQQSQKLYDAGTIPESNLVEAEAQIASAEYTKVIALNLVSTAMSNLKLILDLPVTTFFDVVAPTGLDPEQLPILYQANQIYETAILSQASIKAQDLRVKSAEQNIAIAKSALYPSLNAYGSMNTNMSSVAKRVKSITYSDQTIGYILDTIPITMPIGNAILERTPFNNQFNDNLNQSLGISFNIPLFNAGQTRRAIDKARIAYKQQLLLSQINKQQLLRDIEQAYADANAAFKKYEAAQKKVKAVNKSFGYTQAKAKEGMINNIEYTTMQNNVIQAESELLQAKYEYVFKVKILDFYAGRKLQL